MCYTVVYSVASISYTLDPSIAIICYVMVYSVTYNKLHYCLVDDHNVPHNDLFCDLQ